MSQYIKAITKRTMANLFIRYIHFKLLFSVDFGELKNPILLPFEGKDT
jgi:hypothetical protein